MEKQIRFPDITSVQDFVNRTSAIPAKVELVCGAEHINAKSLMNILCIDLTRPMKMVIYASEKEAKDYFANFTRYLA